MRAVTSGDRATSENGVSNIQMPMFVRALTCEYHWYSASSLAGG